MTFDCNIYKVIGPKPAPVSGYCWVPPWALQKDTGDKSFEELVLDKIKGPQEKKQLKQRKIDATTKVITGKICEKIWDGEKKGKNKTKKQIEFNLEEEVDIPEESEEEIIEEQESESSDEIDRSSGEEAASEK